MTNRIVVKGFLKYAVEDTKSPLMNFELPPVDPKTLKEGMTVLKKVKIDSPLWYYELDQIVAIVSDPKQETEDIVGGSFKGEMAVKSFKDEIGKEIDFEGLRFEHEEIKNPHLIPMHSVAVKINKIFDLLEKHIKGNK
jgi:hypothetical protein